MRKDTKHTVISDYNSNKLAVRLDDLDMKVIILLILGRNNKEISRETKVPLSTIQRRTRRIFEKDIVKSKVEPNYRHLGYSKGMLHLYIRNNDAMLAAQQLAEIDSVIGVSIHIGNSDVLGDIIYRNSMDILDIISKAKKIEGVERVVWSEEVYNVPITRSKERILSYFKQP